ncbi:MAG TPA: PilN domain-containing protein [Gemmatimonadales bacterium]
MSASIGIEIVGRSLRAVRLEGRHRRAVRTVEVPWNPDEPAEGARLLRESLGRAAQVSVAVRLPLLFAKRVRLPPMPPAERRKALRLEPQRYFPVRLEDLVVAVRDDDLVFAAREEAVGAWIGALEALGPVGVVEPGPVALARALGKAGVEDAVVTLEDDERGIGVVEVRAGAVTGVRRIYGGTAEAAGALAAAGDRRRFLSPWTEDRATAWSASLPGAAPGPLPAVGEVPEAYLTAYGAALRAEDGLDGTLLPDEHRHRIVTHRRRRLTLAALAAAASAAFLLASLDAWRNRAAGRLAAEVAALEERARPALELQEQIALLDRRAQGVVEVAAARPDPLEALLAVTRRLPRGAYLKSLRLAGGEWQVDGFAPRAAAVTQALGSAPELSGVRVLGATSRSRTGEGTNESFALAFRLARRP